MNKYSKAISAKNVFFLGILHRYKSKWTQFQHLPEVKSPAQSDRLLLFSTVRSRPIRIIANDRQWKHPTDMTENSRSKKKHKNPQNHQQNELPFSCPLIHSQKKKRTTISILSQWSGKRCLSPFLFRLFFFCSFSLTFPQPLSLFSQRRPAATHDRWIYYILSLVSLGFSLSHLMLLFYFYFFFVVFPQTVTVFILSLFWAKGARFHVESSSFSFFFCVSFWKAQHSPWCWGKTVICYVLWIFFTLGRNVPAQFLFCCKVMFAAAGITIKQFSTCQSPVRGWLHDEMSVCVCEGGKFWRIIMLRVSCAKTDGWMVYVVVV